METRLKQILSEKGLMSKTLAEKMGVSLVTVSSLINGKVNNLDTLAKAAECVGVPVWQLFIAPDALPQQETESKTDGGTSVVCPHCGKSLTIKVEK